MAFNCLCNVSSIPKILQMITGKLQSFHLRVCVKTTHYEYLIFCLCDLPRFLSRVLLLSEEDVTVMCALVCQQFGSVNISVQQSMKKLRNPFKSTEWYIYLTHIEMITRLVFAYTLHTLSWEHLLKLIIWFRSIVLLHTHILLSMPRMLFGSRRLWLSHSGHFNCHRSAG